MIQSLTATGATIPSPQREQASLPLTPAPAPMQHYKVGQSIDYAAALRHASETNGKGYLAQIAEMCRLFFSISGITPHEYFYYALYDDSRTLIEKKKFAGSRLRIRTTNQFLDNYFYGIGLDKLTFHACMRGLGFPIPETRAVFHPSRSLAGAAHLNTHAGLADYLRGMAEYPLFAKPAEQTASLGSAALKRYHTDGDQVELTNGLRFPVDLFVEEAARYFDVGYLFQKPLESHPEIRRIVNGGLSTIRVMILADGGPPEIIRATWRLPVGGNAADVYWRGNMMAALDPDSGEAVRVVQGIGADLVELDCHPDTGQQIRGAVVPMWQEARDLALRAARALPKLELTGWDVAITDGGPVLIELEPDGGEPSVTQMASGRGLLDGPYGEFVRKRGVRKRGVRRGGVAGNCAKAHAVGPRKFGEPPPFSPPH